MAGGAAALVFVGGGAGALARYALVRFGEATWGTDFPYGVFAANLLGSLAMGLLTGWLLARGASLGSFLDLDGHEATRAAFATGLLGGFTTFSAFSLDAVRLWQSGSTALATGYVVASVVLAIGALVAGLMLARMVFA